MMPLRLLLPAESEPFGIQDTYEIQLESVFITGCIVLYLSLQMSIVCIKLSGSSCLDLSQNDSVA